MTSRPPRPRPTMRRASPCSARSGAASGSRATRRARPWRKPRRWPRHRPCPTAHQVARRVVMDQRRARRQRLRHGDDGGQRLVADRQRLRRVARLVERLGHDHGDDVADMAHLAGRHRQVRRLAMAVAGRVLDLADRRQVADLVGQKSRRRCRSRRRRARPARRSCRCRSAAHGRAASARTAPRARRGRGVVGIAAAAGQEPPVLAARIDWPSLRGAFMRPL